jgi:hypothetical protein
VEQIALDLEELAPPAGQLALVDGPQGRRRGREAVPSQVWAELLGNDSTRRRYTAKIYRRGADQCWFWTGAISSTGHAKLQGTRGSRSHIVVTAHVFGWQVEHGLIRPRPGEDPVVAHKCDESSCQNPSHWELVERVVNGQDYLRRRHRAGGPLADVRGAEGRAVAIREAIKRALASGGDVEKAIEAAAAEGLRSVPGLF